MKVLFILATGRSGSAFVHSLFDGHPQVLTYPAIHSLYSPFFHTASLETIDDVVEYVSILTRLGIHFRGAYDEAIGNIGVNNDENFAIDAARFLPLLREELASLGPPLPRRVIVTAIHRAYGRYAGKNPDDMRLMVEHVHSPSELAQALSDFPDAHCIHTLRDPRPAYYGMIELCMKAYGHFKHEFFYKFTKNVFVMPWLNLGFSHLPFRAGAYRIARIEDLNANGEQHMREIASWLGIDYGEELAISTVGDKVCHGNSGTVKSVTGFAGVSPPPRPKAKLSKLDVLRVEALLRGPMRAQGYEPSTEDSLANRLLGFASLFVPLRRELALNPFAIWRDVRVDTANFPLARIIMFQVRRSRPVLYGLLVPLGFAEPARTAHKLLDALLVTVLFGKRVAIDPWLFYVRRVALLVRCFFTSPRAWP
jgi:hypothetical protein